MESNIAVLDQIPDWEESEERIIVGCSELKRFVSLPDVITYYLSNEGSVVNHDLISMIVLCLPSFSTPKDFFDLLRERFDVFQTSAVTTSCREQKQLKILSILHHWAKTQTATYDFSGSLIDTFSDFINEAIARGTEIVILAAKKVKVKTFFVIFHSKLLTSFFLIAVSGEDVE